MVSNHVVEKHAEELMLVIKCLSIATAPLGIGEIAQRTNITNVMLVRTLVMKLIKRGQVKAYLVKEGTISREKFGLSVGSFVEVREEHQPEEEQTDLAPVVECSVEEILPSMDVDDVLSSNRLLQRLGETVARENKGDLADTSVTRLCEFEKSLASSFGKLDDAARMRAGSLLPVIPERNEWAFRLLELQRNWRYFSQRLEDFPHLIVVLFAGIAFFDYEERTFWPHLTKALELPEINQDLRSALCTAYRCAVRGLGLRLITADTGGTSYVDTAVLHIGIPLSLWSDFLGICEWALWKEDWRQLSDQDWSSEVRKRLPNEIRLIKFLTSNRDAASSFIEELHDARNTLSKDTTLTVAQLRQAIFLRSEYFEEVEMTAEFLRPNNPNSLESDRLRLVWDDRRNEIYLQLPAVTNAKLPAKWSINDYHQDAASTPDRMTLNGVALSSKLSVHLQTNIGWQHYLLKGVEPWSLFNARHGEMVNLSKQQRLPIDEYMLVSKDKLDSIDLKGFVKDEVVLNEQRELPDGSVCFVTQLSPKAKTANATIVQNGNRDVLTFKSRLRIKPFLLIGKGSSAIAFSRRENRIQLEEFPLLCVVLPINYFSEPESILKLKFAVLVDGSPCHGQWSKVESDGDSEVDLYVWRRLRQTQGKERIVTNLKDLVPSNFEEKPLKKKHTLALVSEKYGVDINYELEFVAPVPDVAECLSALPGGIISLALACQPTDGIKWDEMLLLGKLIDPSARILHGGLSRYAKEGYLKEDRKAWTTADTRAVLSQCEQYVDMELCGDPSILWGLFRYVANKCMGTILPHVRVEYRKGFPAFVSMRWNKETLEHVRRYLDRHSVTIADSLWRI